MRKWDNNINVDYYGGYTSRQGNSITRSGHDKKLIKSLSKGNDTKYKFVARIEKACPTHSIESYKKEVFLLKKELYRIEKESLKKDSYLFEMKSKYSAVRQLESELEETYRIIYLYEGKIQELQKVKFHFIPRQQFALFKELKRLQRIISNHQQTTISPTDIKSLLNEYRYDNTELSGIISSQNKVIIELEDRLRTVESKYFQKSWELSAQKRIMNNPLKKNFMNLKDFMAIQEMSPASREKMAHELQSKYEEYSKEIPYQSPKTSRNNFLRKYHNEKLVTSSSSPRQNIENSETQNKVKNSTLYTRKVQKLYSKEQSQILGNEKQDSKPRSNQSYKNNGSAKNPYKDSQSEMASLNYSLSDCPLKNGLFSQQIGSSLPNSISLSSKITKNQKMQLSSLKKADLYGSREQASSNKDRKQLIVK